MKRPRRRALRLALAASLAILGALAATASVRADAESIGEYDLKAAFLLNFAQFVEWPSASLDGSGAPFCIGVLGHDPFGSALDEMVRGATVRDRPLVVRRAGDAASLASCQIVYVSRSERSRWPSEAKAFDASAVLTVSDIEDFAERGGIIELYLENRRVRFEINRSQAERSGLKIGSELLSLGKIVGPGAED